MNPPKGGWPSTPERATNQANALRRKKAKRAEPERPDDGLRRFLKADPAVEETMRRAGL